MNQAQEQANVHVQGTVAHPWFDLAEMNRELAVAPAEQRVAWVLEHFPGRVVLTSSFGAQSAVCLHMVTCQQPDIPVVLVDTGYLFPETYQFIDELSERLSLNLQIYRAELSAAWQEARYGKLWEQGLEGIERYNGLNKVEPMQRALRELEAAAWISGLRRQQAKSRQHLDVLLWRNGRCKVHPLIDWTDRDVYRYLSQHNLPYHPLWHQGYVSIGDTHTTRRLLDGMSEEETRFFGLKRECGLHEHV
ncbi:phosphoadenylyl-sulfate reductase [Candidatus Competibacter phosphatis]|uniref:Phosphoadenosine 5'-phosphosulfate reductase n=1 Tax=Candidatus Competibacter phosphatis TaxID=221280 RepID=A0ABX1TJ30_9GAMM|nr:phosphoadenylyl-sulfate reductase [Candidatus Competibacter phosphatis]NMQ18766.1 phosphoadenylyl-sulfate reductase [Candidatus Competibacter phosphatis]